MAFPSNPTDQQEYVAGAKTFRYDAATGRWRVFKAQSTGSAAITQADLTAAVENAGAILGTDYTYVHNDNTTVTITALNAGNYKFSIL